MAEETEEIVPIRYNIPKHLHAKVHKYKRILTAVRDDKVTAEDALIEILNQFQVPELHDIVKAA